MPGQLHIIRPDSTERTIETRDLDHPPSLQELNALVGGYLEHLPHIAVFTTQDGPKPCVALCNEDGQMLSLPENRLATELCGLPLVGGYPLVGTVLIFTGSREFMNEL